MSGEETETSENIRWPKCHDRRALAKIPSIWKCALLQYDREYDNLGKYGLFQVLVNSQWPRIDKLDSRHSYSSAILT